MPTWITSLLGSTDPTRRRLKAATIVGLIGGAFSALVKFGWEVPFPPRTPGLRSETNPPQSMLEWFGMSHDTSHMMVTFSNNQLPIMSFIVHFSFAIAFGLIYCIAAEYFPRIKMWQGAVFGIAVYVGAHVIVMPLLAAVFNAVGILGGWVVSVPMIGVDPGMFWSQMQGGVSVWADLGNGIVKSVVFGVTVTFVALLQGYAARPTAEGVARATTRTVVMASLLVLGLDFVLTAFMFSL